MEKTLLIIVAVLIGRWVKDPITRVLAIIALVLFANIEKLC